MGVNEQIREIQSLILAYRSEISIRQVYLANEERWTSEANRLDQQIAYLEEKRARLHAYRHDGDGGVHACHDRIAVLQRQLAELRNKSAIERVIKLQREVNEGSERILENSSQSGDPTVSEKHSTL